MFSHLYGLPCDHSVKAHDVRVELLGAHAHLEIRMFNVVAFKGLKCNEYLGSRCLSSTLLTFIKVSPTYNDELKEPVTVEGSPTKKAMHMKSESVLSAEQVKELMKNMKTRADASGLAQTEQRFSFIGKVVPIDESIFLAGTPFYGPDNALRFRFKAKLTDGRNILDKVTMWPDAAREVTCLDAETVSDLWEKCDEAEGKEAFLDAMNQHLYHSYVFNCSLKTWKFGGDDNRSVEVQVSVNNAEKRDA